MKKFFTVSFLFLLISVVAIAQPKLGIKAGGNIANLSGDDVENPDSKFGFAFGGFFEYQFSPLFAVQPEIYYTMKGATDKASVTGGTVDITYTLDYIEVPILLKVVIPVQGSKINPSIFAGPFLGFNTTAKIKAEFQGQSQEEDIQDVKSTEFGAQFGGGIGFDVGRNEVGFDIRYILGLTTLDDSAEKADVKTNAINFNVYYAFSLL
jgi:Outer membrane protein beta-barrel domain